MKIRILFFILVFLILIYGCAQNTTDKGTKYKDLTSEELKQMLDSDADIFLVDVHIPEQQHIKGTDAFVPYDEIENNLNLLPDKNAKIVLYCRSGSMSKEAAQKLADLGYKNVLNHLGGTIDWKNKGFEFE
ncbi:rhodanese-like domain-containing protein [Candidatus Woesearchaeota archaeon]|nr:rhodanese-like domain-containing protein [Candidatus Woesearchaeota archaeon]